MNALFALLLAAAPLRAVSPVIEPFAPSLPPLRFQARSPWEELAAKVLTLGAFRESDGVLPAGYGLEDVRGPRTSDHTADYVNVWGFKDSAGKFVPAFMTLVSERWTVDAQDRWRIAQWLLTLRLDGSIERASSHDLVETRDGMVLDYTSRARGADDAETRARLSALLDGWLAFARPRAR